MTVNILSKIDFGVQIEPQFGYLYKDIKEIANEAEKIGFESIWISDHFMIRQEAIDVNCLEAWSVLTALARDTNTLRLGPMVTSQSYRNPVLLAKMAASLDNISEGRLYFGIGAGWKEIEYKAYNIPFPKPIIRIKQLNETLEIAKRMFYKQKADYQGKYYRVNNCVAMPKPIQNPLPIVIGGTGNQTLKVTAKHANIANFAWNTPLDIFEEKLRILETHCNKIGRNPTEIRKSAGLIIKLDNVEASKDAPYIKYTGASSRESKTPGEAIEFIKSYLDLGVDHIVIMFPYGEEKESMKIIKKEIVPRI